MSLFITKSRLLLSTGLMLCGSAFFTSAAQANDDYQAWLKQTQSDFQTYLDENDKDFLKLLSAKWQEVDIEPAKQQDIKPKPVVMPAVATPDIKPKKTEEPKTDNKRAAKPVPIVAAPITKPKNDAFDIEIDNKQREEKPVPVVKAQVANNEVLYKFDFFGEKIEVSANKNFKTAFYGRINNQSIADYWKKLATKPHKKIIEQLTSISHKMQLNTWGQAMLVDSFSRAMHGFGTSRRLSSWFLLTKSGLDVKVAYNSDVYLLLPSKQTIYGKTFFTLNNKRYYAIDFSNDSKAIGKVYTFAGRHSTGSGELDFSQPQALAINAMPKERKLSFDYAGQQYDFAVNYSQQKVNFYNSYPQLSLDQYFKEDLPVAVKQQMKDQLAPLVKGKSATESVNLLLRFVQTAFSYQTDGQQFKQENYLYPLETLHYPYSDCEDRAALFGWLVKNILNLPVVILDYPGHVATAVAMPNKVKGDSWQVKGKTFTVADPTYINASLGMTMPQFSNTAPKVVSL